MGLVTVEDKQFVREGPRFSTNKSKGFRRPFGGFGQQQTSHGPSTPAGFSLTLLFLFSCVPGAITLVWLWALADHMRTCLDP